MATCLGKAFPSLEESLCAKSGKAGGGAAGAAAASRRPSNRFEGALSFA